MTDAKKLHDLECSVRRLKSGALAVGCIIIAVVSLGAANVATQEDVKTSNIEFVDPKSGKTIASLGVTKYGDIALTTKDADHAVLFSLRKGKSLIQAQNGGVKASLTADANNGALMIVAGDNKASAGVIAYGKTEDNMTRSTVRLWDGGAKDPRVEVNAVKPNSPDASAYIVLRDRFGGDAESVLYKNLECVTTNSVS